MAWADVEQEVGFGASVTSQIQKLTLTFVPVLEADELSSKRKLELTPSGKENIRPSPGKRIRQSEVDELLRGVPAPAMVIDPSSTRKDLFSALKAKRRVRRATFSSGTTTDNDPDL